MWDFSLSGALAAMRKTAPFIVFRMLVYFGIALLYILATGLGSGLGYGLTSFGDNPGSGAGWGALIGFTGASGFLYWAREYILYLVKAGHIAVLIQHHDGKQLPEGRGQIDYAREIVTTRFKEASFLFALDQLIKGVLKILNGVIFTLTAFLPIPGIDNLRRIVNSVLNLSLTYVDEILLAQCIRNDDKNPWESARQGLILYAQNYPAFIKNAIWLAVFMWGLTLLIFILIMGPVFALLQLFPGELGFWAFIISFLVAWSFKSALLEPLAMYALMQVYFKHIEGQEPNPEWEQRLSAASDKFRQLSDKATSAFSPGASKPTAAPH